MAAEVVELDVVREAADLRRLSPRWFLARVEPGVIDRTAALLCEHRARCGRISMAKFTEMIAGLRALGMTPLARAEARARGFVEDDDGGHDGGAAA